MKLLRRMGALQIESLISAAEVGWSWNTLCKAGAFLSCPLMGLASVQSSEEPVTLAGTSQSSPSPPHPTLPCPVSVPSLGCSASPWDRDVPFREHHPHSQPHPWARAAAGGSHGGSEQLSSCSTAPNRSSAQNSILQTAWKLLDRMELLEQAQKRPRG